MLQVLPRTLSAFCLATVLAAQPSVTFTDANQAANLNSMFTGGGTEHSGGAAWIDYNNDLLDDLLISNGLGFQTLFYRNNGDGTFTDVSALLHKPRVTSEVCGVVYGDVDNDGDSDVLMIVDHQVRFSSSVGGPNLFFVNQGDGTFVEQALSRGLVDPLGRRNICGGFADYDRDGFIDVFLDAWDLSSVPALWVDPGGDVKMHMPGVLRRNTGLGTFVDVTAQMGTHGYGRNALASLWFDSNFDLYPDLYIGNVGEIVGGPFSDDVYYMYDPQEGRFTDVTGRSPGIGNDAKAAMGMDVADVDGDGYWDLYITDTPGPGAPPLGNVLYFGKPQGQFTDNKCDIAGVCTSDSAWPCKFEDFNLDGWPDLWVGTTNPWANDHLFLNNCDGTFSPTAPQPAFQNNQARGGTTSDYDGDGDVDIVVVNHLQNSRLLRNDTATSSNWVEFKLYGTASNRDAIGALVKVTTGDLTQMRRVSGGDSAHSQASLILHFGVAAAAKADVSVSWPSGVVQNFKDVTCNQLVLIDESQGILPEVLESISARWSASQQTLQISASGNYGGRTSFTCSFGNLTYSSLNTKHQAVFAGVTQDPGLVQLTSALGNTFGVPVTQIP